MIQDVKNLIFSALSLPEDCGHSVTESLKANIYFVHGTSGIKYMACRIARSQADDGEDDLRVVLSELPTAGTGIQLTLTGALTKILRKSFRTGDYDYIAALESPSLLAASNKQKPGTLKPLSAKLENVLFEVHSAFRDIDGLHAPDVLNSAEV